METGLDFESTGNVGRYILEESSPMKLINLTPHDIVFRSSADAEPFLVIPPTHPAARVTVVRKGVAIIKVEKSSGRKGKGWQNNSVESPTLVVNKTTFGEIENLPEEQENVGYIVSRVVAEAALEEDHDGIHYGRRDLYIVDDLVRDENGNVVGARSLARLW